MVAKGYTLSHARLTIVKMVRPICQACRKPIKGAHEGALFHKENKRCHSAYVRFNKLRKQGLTNEQALARLSSSS